MAYCPEVDVSPLLDATMITRFQNGLGVLRLIVELGRIDIMTEVAMLSAHNAMPRRGFIIFPITSRGTRIPSWFFILPIP